MCLFIQLCLIISLREEMLIPCEIPYYIVTISDFARYINQEPYIRIFLFIRQP